VGASPKLYFLFFLQLATLIGPSQRKNHDTFNTPQILAFFYPIWNYGGALPHCLSRTFIPNFVYRHFWHKLS
jgi:hypothetical protein